MEEGLNDGSGKGDVSGRKHGKKPVRFSDKVAVVSAGTILSLCTYIVSYTWKIRDYIDEIKRTERDKTTRQLIIDREEADERFREFKIEVKEKFSDNDEDIRDFRKQIIQLYGRNPR